MSPPRRRSTSQPVPISVWVLSIAFASVLFYVLTSVFEPPVSEAFQEHNSERIEDLRDRTSDDAAPVIFLGDSRLRYAAHDDEVLSRQLSEAADRPVETLRLVNNWAVYDDFAPLIDSLLDTKPALIVIQAELLTKERARPGRLLIGRQYLLWRLFGAGPWNPGDLDQALLQNEQRCEVLADETLEQRRDRVFEWVSFDADGAAADNTEAFVAEARARGIRVEYLGIPITSAATAGLPGPEPNAELDVLSPPFEIADTEFCDFVHLDPGGRDAYSTWLVTTIADMLPNDST